jgi:tRNA nucleotidyltransferase (CCA-adding enzyme)
MEKLISKIEKSLLPSNKLKTKIHNIKELAFKRLKKVVPKDVEIVLCGSVAKDTYLKENLDMDIFLLFDKSYLVEQIKKLGLYYAKKAFRGFKTKINYAQHPYLMVYIDGIKLDIVPSSKIQNLEKINTSVDRSQLHTDFINKHLSEQQKNQVRLLKKFLIAQDLYGASLKVEGFSGYLCELLILYYGSFLNLLKAAALEWKKELVIDINKFYSPTEALKKFEPATFVVVDPIDKNRNVAAVVSRTSYSRFIFKARKFLEKPSKKFFYKKKKIISKNKLKKIIIDRGSCSIVLKFKNPGLVEDILFPQLRKATNSFLAELENNDFRPIGYYFYADEEVCFILLEIAESSLPNIKKIQGPEIFDQKNINGFILKHKKALNIHIEHHKIVAVEKRKYTNPYQLIKILKSKKSIGIPKGIFNVLKNATIFYAHQLLNNKAFFEIATDYYLRKITD